MRLEIDQSSGTIRLDGRELSVRGGSLLFRALVLLGRAGTEGLTKEELFTALWGAGYRCVNEGQRVYMTIQRLRDWVPVLLSKGRYSFPEHLTCTQADSSESEPAAGALLPRRLRHVLSTLESHPKVDRRCIAQLLGVSPRTALRDLNALVELGLLERAGLGRATCYRKAAQP